MQPGLGVRFLRATRWFGLNLAVTGEGNNTFIEVFPRAFALAPDVQPA